LLVVRCLFFFFFFFQAEDGIRDLYVTGVQTCALPISSSRSTASPKTRAPESASKVAQELGSSVTPSTETKAELMILRMVFSNRRSEERRVGKGCRSRRGT